MLKKVAFLMMLFFVSTVLSAQEIEDRGFSVGGGYYGESIFHPGFVVQAERDIHITETISIPVRFDIGYYMHKRSHSALFADAATGVRFHIGRAKMWYSGLGVSVGPMFSWYNSDLGVYEVDDMGVVRMVSNYAGVDFMPAINAEVGYRVSRQCPNYIWVRPKVLMQMKVNEKNFLHFALEVGYSHAINF